MTKHEISYFKNRMKLSKDKYFKVRDFILTNARMIERRLFEFHFVRRFIVYLLSRFYRVICYYSYFIF